MNTLKTKNMTNIYQSLWEKADHTNMKYAAALGTAKGYLEVIKKYPEEAYETAIKALKHLEELSTEIYKPTEDAKV